MTWQERVELADLYAAAWSLDHPVVVASTKDAGDHVHHAWTEYMRTHP